MVRHDLGRPRSLGSKLNTAWLTIGDLDGSANVECRIRRVESILAYTRVVAPLAYLGQIAAALRTLRLSAPRDGM